MHFKLNPCALAFTSLFLVACSGGKGSFDLEDVQPNQTAKAEKATTSYQDEETKKKTKEELDKLMEPALGYEVKIPRRNRALFDKEGNRKTAPDATDELSEAQMLAIWNENIDEIPHLKELNDKTTSYLIYHSHDSKREDKKRNLQYVRSGYVYDESYREMVRNENSSIYIFKNGIDGYIYYLGTIPSKELPKGNKVTYKGTWDFTSDVKTSYELSGFSDAGNGKNVAATSISDNVNRDHKVGDKVGENEVKGVAHSSEFVVDFDNKKLTGSLYRNGYVSRNTAQEITKRYSIEADITGNRFRGKAKAEKVDDPIFTNSDYLEGGFYGPKAEEMAGKFFTNNKSLFAVFAAKSENGETTTERIIDATKIDLTQFNAKELNNFGDASVLIIDGQKMDLVGVDFKNSKTVEINGKTMVAVACCSNLEYMKFGQLWQKEGEQQVKDNSLFLQGERTATDKMPAGGNYKYVGTWDALVSKGTNWIAEADNNRESGYRSEFDVNFGDKKVSGKLFDKGGVNPVFTVDATINGNGFIGSAKTSDSGFALDAGSSQHGNAVFSNVDVKGGFYGPTAGELGGQFHHKSDNGSVGAVFGAKRQVEK
ncbi:transferrin-binding protein-like solute binding protein [Glaesserella parasuis]|uniref:transferrin-binding protein-like solute binding protein n=1 Tax=Glaesserella parasuis TaxID=738 RepID=UPI0013657BD1|nr:transferrin-binding protein-like solute binding protein [Glaesserella parasuis]MWP82930.1 transferrin-binding protein-like solute binding protein [Glaesserella parasuis]